MAPPVYQMPHSGSAFSFLTILGPAPAQSRPVANRPQSQPSGGRPAATPIRPGLVPRQFGTPLRLNQPQGAAFRVS